MADVKISIITPMYNCESYIVDSINSVINQEFDDLEIIVIDDCSTDNSYAVCNNHFGHLDNVKILRQETNQGQWAAIERGFKIAHGKYIRFVHADDVLMPNALQTLYDFAEQSNADVVHEIAHYQSLEGNGSIIKEGSQLKLCPHESWLVDKPTLMPNDLNIRLQDFFERGTFVDCVYNLFRRDMFIKNDIKFRECGGNFFLTLQWLMTAKVFVKLPFASYIYRLNPTSVTLINRDVNFAEQVIDWMVEIVDHIEEFMDKVEFFKDKKYLRELVKMESIEVFNQHWFKRLGFYKNGGGGGIHLTSFMKLSNVA